MQTGGGWKAEVYCIPLESTSEPPMVSALLLGGTIGQWWWWGLTSPSEIPFTRIPASLVCKFTSFNEPHMADHSNSYFSTNAENQPGQPRLQVTFCVWARTIGASVCAHRPPSLHFFPVCASQHTNMIPEKGHSE